MEFTCAALMLYLLYVYIDSLSGGKLQGGEIWGKGYKLHFLFAYKMAIHKTRWVSFYVNVNAFVSKWTEYFFILFSVCPFLMCKWYKSMSGDTR